ncbi:MAG: FapA family protein [Elusimicrobia bacterium]|nr:FapA family protein [Elusimicrobiota bacterium]
MSTECKTTLCFNYTGRDTLEYYSLDRVQNTEQLKTASLAVDNTPPVTAITLGEPKFTAFGLPVITPDTPITLTAADPVVNGAASGLRRITYEIIEVRGQGSEVRNYMEPFKLPQGTYDVRYWSVDNVTNTEPYKKLRLAVSTLQKDALAAVDGLELSGNADITGAVESNAVVSVKGNVRILGDVAASTITITGKAQITGRQTSGVTPLVREPVYLADIVSLASTTNNNGLVDPKYLVDGKFIVSAQADIILSTGTYYFKGIKLSGGCNITVNGEVNILAEGEVVISGGSSLNAAGPASALKLFANTASTLTFIGGGKLAAYVYAPYSHMKLSGKALLGGHYFLRTAAVSGTGNVVQSGESLPQAAVVTADSGGKKKATALGTEAAGVKISAGPDPTFKLGEVYVFPNPTKGGAVPVFHIEAGIADSVKILVYTVAGRIAHEHTLTSPPTALDDGNGLAYAYEYAWDGHIPSGVYYYYIEAEKAGRDLKKTGKFAVIR